MSIEEDDLWISSVTAPRSDHQLNAFAPGFVPADHTTAIEESAEHPQMVMPAAMGGAGFYYAPQQFIPVPVQAPMMYYPAPQSQMVAVQTPQGVMMMPMPVQPMQQPQPAPPPPPPAYHNQHGGSHYGSKPPPKYNNNYSNDGYHNNSNGFHHNNPPSHRGGGGYQGPNSHNPSSSSRGGRGGGGGAGRVPYHPVIFPNPKSPPQTVVTVVKAPPSHRGAKGLIPIDGFDDDFDHSLQRHSSTHNDSTHSNPYDVSPNNTSMLDAPAVLDGGAGGDDVAESPGNVTCEVEGENSPLEREDTEVAPIMEEVATAPTIVKPTDATTTMGFEDAPKTSPLKVVLADEPVLASAEKSPSSTTSPSKISPSIVDEVEVACDTDIRSPPRSVDAAILSPPLNAGPRPPMGIDGEEGASILPRPVAPSGILPFPPPAMGSNPANPIFVIPARCTSKNLEGKTTFKCPYCNQQGFLSEYVLRSHLRARHTSDASFLVRSSLTQLILPYLRDFLAVDGPVSGGSASVKDAIDFLPEDIRADIRDATHFEAITTKDDDFVVFEYTPDELKLHRITSDVAVAGELRIALIDAPYVRRDTDRSVGVVA